MNHPVKRESALILSHDNVYIILWIKLKLHNKCAGRSLMRLSAADEANHQGGEIVVKNGRFANI